MARESPNGRQVRVIRPRTELWEALARKLPAPGEWVDITVTESTARDLGQEPGMTIRAGLVRTYIGETDENLAGAFSDAQGGVLLFDEADPLFGKRTEAHDAHDRYANIQPSFLMRRAELQAIRADETPAPPRSRHGRRSDVRNVSG